MPHVFDPSDERSPASTFAPDQPGRGVVADDVEDKQGKESASEATEADTN